MAKIIYKGGYEGYNKLSCIEGIEIKLFNGQKALIYPKYAERELLTPEQVEKYIATIQTEIESLKVEDTISMTAELLKIGSPAAEWVSRFHRSDYIKFSLPSLISAIESMYHKKEIDSLAEKIEGADLLRDFTSIVGTGFRCSSNAHWVVSGYSGCVYSDLMIYGSLVIPTILY